MGVTGSDMHAAEGQDAAAEAAGSLSNAFKTIDQAGRLRHAAVLEYWYSIRGEREFPPLHDLDPLAISDAGPSSALLELIGGGEDAEIRHLGETLKTDVTVERIIDAPRPSILASIAKKLSIVAISRNFLAFEDEYAAANGTTRCWITLLPLSSAGAWVDYVYAFATFETVAAEAESEPVVADAEPIEEPADEEPSEPLSTDVGESTDILPIHSQEANSAMDEAEQGTQAARDDEESSTAEIEPAADETAADETAAEDMVADSDPATEQGPGFSELAHSPATADGFYGAPTVKVAPPRPSAPVAAAKVAEPAGAADGPLQDKLATVRAKADEARMAKLRSNSALYEGLGAAYDFALDAEDNAEEYLKLVEAHGLKIQLRSPMQPVMKLAFNGMCDDPTLARLEAVLAWALEQELPRGSLAERIEAEGGLARILNGEVAGA